MSDGLLTPKKAAAFCSLHYRTFLALARKEGLKADAVYGSRKRYEPATLKRFGKTLAQRREQGAA